jgi:hypothetical protein
VPVYKFKDGSKHMGWRQEQSPYGSLEVYEKEALVLLAVGTQLP